MKSLYEQKANKCRHYNGTINAACEAGVKYETVRVSRGPGKGYALPCFKDEPEKLDCPHQSFKTHDEVEAEIAESNKRFENTMKARKVIVESLGGPWKKGMEGSQGSILCPVCGTGTLSFTRAGYNGHIHARCSTSGCVAWME